MAPADLLFAYKRLHISTLLFGILFLTAGCTSKTGSDSSPKFKQYYVQGEQLYLQHCSNCHQENGTGLGLLYPPLDTSDYMQKNLEDVVCLIRNGKQGDLVVNGKTYNQRMPAVPITDLEIAEISTYIYNTWSHRRGMVDVKLVSDILKSCDTLAVK